MDPLALYLLLPDVLQSQLTLPQVRTPTTIQNKSLLLEYVQWIYERAKNHDSSASINFHKVDKYLPDYQKIILVDLLGKEDLADGMPDFTKLFIMLQSSLSDVVSLPALIHPDRMKADACVDVLKQIAVYCKDHERSGEEYDEVVRKLPNWTSILVNNLLENDNK
uniref:Major non-capsid protein n=1 Tax=Lygus hesperus TaxID=30085 RepID=A0A0A9YU63_LYGHE